MQFFSFTNVRPRDLRNSTRDHFKDYRAGMKRRSSTKQFKQKKQQNNHWHRFKHWNTLDDRTYGRSAPWARRMYTLSGRTTTKVWYSLEDSNDKQHCEWRPTPCRGLLKGCTRNWAGTANQEQLKKRSFTNRLLVNSIKSSSYWFLMLICTHQHQKIETKFNDFNLCCFGPTSIQSLPSSWLWETTPTTQMEMCHQGCFIQVA